MINQVQNPYGLLPLKIGPLIIRQLVWGDFIELDYHENSVYHAHIYWSINYNTEEQDGIQQIKTLSVKVSEKSWVIKSLKQSELLAHQAGHYIIGCLCALDFLKQVNTAGGLDSLQKIKLAFDNTLRKWLSTEKKYDEETQHYVNRQKQKAWNEYLSAELYKNMDLFPYEIPDQ